MEIRSDSRSDSSSAYTFWQGSAKLQGATLVDDTMKPCGKDTASGTNFAVYAPEATGMTLCLFDSSDEETRLEMFSSTGGIWHIYVENIGSGQLYGFRADGPSAPHVSPRFNRHKLLMDPYAREVQGAVEWCEALFDYKPPLQEQNSEEWLFSTDDSAPFMPRCVVRDPEFDWQGTKKPLIADQSRLIYEVHLKGFTQNHPDIPKHLHGTYLGFCHPVAIAHLKNLGITTVELMSVTSKVSEQRLINLGLTNYWGYNPLCLMAPESSFAIKDPVTELKTLIRELHREGIEVFMDVVFNHTCEAGHGSAFFSMRGLAEGEYYHMDSHDGQAYSLNYSGCGNTMNFDSPQTLKLTMDALRHWVEEYQVDGFRFDLASILGRQFRRFNRQSPFFFALSQDPVLSRVKMIAEPWDVGPDGYQLTNFPREWQCWNDRYRDGCRKFWNGTPGQQSEMALRLSGSNDLFVDQSYLATINYICSHDGFTLMDLVSYNERHNFDNREYNRDGDSHNNSWNHGAEGKARTFKIQAARRQSRKNLIATLMLARGTPMLMAGDEFSNSQKGNNNAYCQDSPVSWLDWQWLDQDTSDGRCMLEFTRQMMALRRQLPMLMDGSGKTLYDFFGLDGQQLAPETLCQQSYQGLSVKIHSDHKSDNETLIVLMNCGHQPVSARFSKTRQENKRWFVIVRTDREESFINEPVLFNDWYEVPGNTLMVIKEID